jgi:hypothetical protein
MKRTHLYIEEDILRILRRISKKRSTTISELVQDALRKVYAGEQRADSAFILRETAGIWKDRKDIRSAEEYVRTMRRDTRRESLG